MSAHFFQFWNLKYSVTHPVSRKVFLKVFLTDGIGWWAVTAADLSPILRKAIRSNNYIFPRKIQQNFAIDRMGHAVVKNVALCRRYF